MRAHFQSFMLMYLFRYEFTNKGADIFIEALARLNHLLKQSSNNLHVSYISWNLHKYKDHTLATSYSY